MPRPVKLSFTVTCPSGFRDQINALARRSGVNAADLARSILLTVPGDVIGRSPDPGEPERNDRDLVTLKSGASAGRTLRRKPRLQLRLPGRFAPATIRKALGLALAMDRGEFGFNVGAGGEDQKQLIDDLYQENERLLTLLSVLSFKPLPEGPRTRAEALHVLGFPPGEEPVTADVRAKFKMLATIHHPDSGYGDNQRMGQLNQAMDLLRN